jgi:hypothetical protein
MKRIIAAYWILSLFVLNVMAQGEASDFLKQLQSVVGVSEIKSLQSDFFKEKYVMKIEQNLDG